MDAASQKIKIIDYCEQHGSITVREASEILKINSPTSRLSELRKAGWIEKEVEEFHINSDGKKVRFKRYYIGKPIIN